MQMQDAQETPAGAPANTEAAVASAPPVPAPGPLPGPSPAPGPPPLAEPPGPPEAGAVDAFKAAAEAEAAAALATILKGQPGIVAELVTGGTVAEVQTAFAAAQKAYAEVKQQVLADLGAALPGGHAGGGGGPLPSTPYELIAAGIQQAGGKQ